MKKILLTVLLSFTVIRSFAAYDYAFSQTSIGNGLNSQTLNTLAKDRFGRLWIGTDIGIAVLSNSQTECVNDILASGTRVFMGNVRSIACTDHALIATDTHIIDYNIDTNRASIIGDGNHMFVTRYICQLDDATAVFFENSLKTLYSYNMTDGSCTPLMHFPADTNWTISKIAKPAGEGDVIYLADTQNGIYMYDIGSGRLERIDMIEERILAPSMVIDRENIIWVSSLNHGVCGYYINNGYRKIATYDSGNSVMPNDQVTAICPLPNGNLALANFGKGLSLIDRRNISGGSQFIGDPCISGVNAMIVDESGSEYLFATMKHGLVTMKKTFFRLLEHTNDHGKGVVSHILFHSMLEESEEVILAGTAGEGIKRINVRTLEEDDFPETDGMRVTAMCEYDNDRIMFYAQNTGLFLMEKSTGRVSHIPRKEKPDEIMPVGFNNLKFLNTPDGGIMMFNFDSYHMKYDIGSDSYQEIDPLSLRGVTVDAVCASETAAYICYGGCISEIDFNSLQSRMVFNGQKDNVQAITSMATDSKGILYFIEPEGIHRYSPMSGHEELILKAEGLGRFYNVAIDRNDIIWFNTTTGYVQSYNPANGELSVYTTEDGIPESHFTNRYSFCTTDGVILFPCTDGIVEIDTRVRNTQPAGKLSVACLSASTDNREFRDDVLSDTEKNPLKLTAKDKNIRLSVSANSFNPTYRHIFRYTIYRYGVAESVVTSPDNELLLTNLEQGHYEIRVSQISRHGLSEEQHLLSFNVSRPFIASVPGVLILFILILLFGYAISSITRIYEKSKNDRMLAAQDIKNREDKIAFLSNIAHELRTPLSLIYNPVKDFLQEKSVDGIDYERMERIYNQVNKMTVMVNMILDSSRADINKADILVEEVNLNEWLNFILEDYRIDCYGRGISLKFIMDQSVGTVYIDKRIVETGLSNMVNNAIKYSSEGTITVSTARNGDYIRVSVRDQGHGFSCNPEDLFKRYYREDNSGSVPGYGLGLPYAKLQLSLIGGNMSACNNEDGIGSTFYMDFPATVSLNGQTARPAAGGKTKPHAERKPDAQEEAMAQDFDTRNMNVMFVCMDGSPLDESMAEMQDMFRIVMKETNVSDALNTLKRMKIDLVVSDIELEGSDGFLLCRSIKQTLEISHIPVLMLTSRTDPRNREMGYKMGADSFMPKPVDRTQLYRMMRSQLGGRFEIKRQYNYGFFNMMSPDQTFSLTDEKFIISLNGIIQNEISNPHLDEEFIHERMKLPRTVLLKKMEGLLDTNLSDYIARIRRQKD